MYKGALGTGKKDLKELQEREDYQSWHKDKATLLAFSAFRAERASFTRPGSSCSFSTVPHLSARKCVLAVTAPVSSSSLPGMGELRRKSEVLYKKLNYLPLWVVRRWKGTWMFKIVKKNSSLLCTEEAEESEYVTAGQCVLQPAGITKSPGKWEYCQAETPKSLNLYQKALTSFTTDSNNNNICFLKGKKMRNICPWTSEAGVMHHFRPKRMKNLMV